MQPKHLKPLLLSCGYRPDLIRSDFPSGDDYRVPLVGFATSPMDSRSACVAVAMTNGDPRTSVERCKPLGAPIVFHIFQETLQWWKQGVSSAELMESITSDQVDVFFQTRKEDFSPEAIYRAKTLGRVRDEYQQSFVDMGLMPLVERQVGEAVSALIERVVNRLKSRLGWKDITEEQGHWLLRSVFQLVAAKILRDKYLPLFKDIDLEDIDNVFLTVKNHYGTNAFQVGSKAESAALVEAARSINAFSDLSLVTPESIGYVYENTLISNETRVSLSVHSTPPFLVDYIVGNLAEWIEEIPEKDRRVFEPACGHAAFLVSAMRLFTELLAAEKAIPSRRKAYLRDRLHGTEVDPFALELARLSLTLADIPNPDGWDLIREDMFLSDRLSDRTRDTTILLANPPFEKFSDAEFFAYSKEDGRTLRNKAAETLRRTLPALKPGSVFGVVVPQSILHGKITDSVRRYLVENFELREISLLPDKVFTISGSESAILIGRRFHENKSRATKLRYRRIREGELAEFRQTYDTPNSRVIDQSRFNDQDHWDLRVPDLEEVWLSLDGRPKAGDVADFAKGLIYHGKHLPEGSSTHSDIHFTGAYQGYIRIEKHLDIHQLPKLYWMSLDKESIQSGGPGASIGCPQVLMNYARVSRGPWRLKAWIDTIGRPVTSRFITVRPKSIALEVLWALLNSPIANAYAYCHSGKRDNLVGDMRRIPMPDGNEFDEIEIAARDYLKAANEESRSNQLPKLMRRLDAAVIRSYEMSIDVERRLLSLFTGWRRVGVPFQQNRFFPEDFNFPVRYSDFVAYESDWSTTNRSRGELIDKEISSSLSDEEAIELAGLEAYADYYLEHDSPRPTHVLDELERRLFGATYHETKDL